MSYSNTSTGSKSADPYKDANKDSPPLREKVEDLVAFIKNSKFGMLTTRIQESGLLSSRCMAVAAQVNPFPVPIVPQTGKPNTFRHYGCDLTRRTSSPP